MLTGALNNFPEPCITMFHEQITLNGLSFPELSQLAGELGEISAGIMLFALVIFWENLPAALADMAFHPANLLIIFITFVVLFIHLQPDVPAEILPFGYKPPVSTAITMALALLNIYRHRRDHFATAY